MPIFEYLCEDCGTKFEKLMRRPSDVDALVCPSCGLQRLKQELSVFAAHASSTPARSSAPGCPSGGVCPHPGMCGLDRN
jgi:putative FmdB family regulatory protein